MYIDDGISVDQIDASSGTLTVGKINSKIDGTNTRSIIHFTKYSISSGFDDLDIDIKLKRKTDPQTTIYVVVYGVKGQVNNVPVNLWDRSYYYDDSSLNYEVPINMNYKDITNVNKITTIDLNVTNQLNMNNKKIEGVGVGTELTDAVNKAQLTLIQSSLTSQIQTLNNQIQTLNNKFTNYGHYYFTKDLKHDNENFVRFPNFYQNPFSTATSKALDFHIRKNGYYHIIYTDNYKNSGTFYIRETHSSQTLFEQSLNNSSNWIPITINALIRASIPQGYLYANLHIGFGLNSSGILDGVGYSTFFIKYIGEL